MSNPQVPMSKPTVVGIERLLDIFEAFQNGQKPLSLTDLAEATGIPKSTCHAIVATLSARGYLYSLTRPRSLYPTKRLFDVASDILKNDPFIDRAAPLLERLRDATCETIILGKQQVDRVVYLHVSEGQHSIRYSAKAGDIKPMHASAIGKALLGSMKEPALRDWLLEHELPAITARTITSSEKLMAEISRGRQLGYFQTRGENVADVWAISAFFRVDNETFGVAVAGPQHRLETSIAEHAQQLVATCSFMAKTLGGRG
jgi:DNA-binding IclR family transcriptional regulator